MLLLASALFTASRVAEDYFEISKNMEIFTSLYKELNIYYVDETKPGSLMKSGIDAMLKSLDPYTVYYPESKIEDYRFMTTGQYGGIGAQINSIDGRIVVTEPQEGFAAARAGILAGDVILKIDGKSTIGKTVEELGDFLTGQPGTDVEIEISRPGEYTNRTFKIKRQEIKVPDVPYFAMLNDETGYVLLTGFTQTASSDVRNAINNLKTKGMKNLVLDLRGNGGGLLREAVNIVNFFVPKGTEITRTKGKIDEWNKTYYAINEPLDTQMPVIVLVDGMSASASEVVSGSLQDLDRAVVAGEESFGKGLVQQTKDLAYNTKLKLTIAKYYTPSGRCIQRLDYSHRDEKSGKVSAVSDSLITAFKTKNGRTVHDGRGIDPDVDVENEEMSNVLEALIDNWIVFDWATQFRSTHASIDSASDFHLSDAQYAEFMAYALAKKFEYNTRSEELFSELKKTAEQEKYFEDAEAQFNELFKVIEPNAENDLVKFKSQIRFMLENEIVSRYYFQSGRIKHKLPGDPLLKKTLEVFDTEYDALLAGPASGKK